MSEELQQVIPIPLGPLQYYRLGSTTVRQLAAAGLVPKKAYASVSRKKPDGLVLGSSRVLATVEYKPPGDLASPASRQRAIKQEIAVARALGRLLIVTDGVQSLWINALNGERVLATDGTPINRRFHPPEEDRPEALAHLLAEIDASITLDNSTIRKTRELDPSALAARLWQTIWVATGKSPVKCLYNVVELFVFKFLSDLGVLPDDLSFASIHTRATASHTEGLEYYAKLSRPRIMALFPEGRDGTTIINGTIFVAENGEPNLSQSILFRRSLDHLHDYTEEFGSLTRIDKRFKTKLYESFLGQEVQALGQYFTPRVIVQSIIRMAGLDSSSFDFLGKRICDPFCGVGGFLLELINLNERLRSEYTPKNKKIKPRLVLHGFDKGFERDDERTVILAKANMLIYLAEVLFAHPDLSVEMARVFNDTFTLFKDNLGTFGYILKDEDEKYDLVLSNPPYVTSGSSILKEELKATPRTADLYPISGLGLESLALEWIVGALKPEGRGFLVIPDGILGRVNGKKLRDHILDECFLEAIVSLPMKTFFANNEHTYVMVLRKKGRSEDVQTDPVFTYLVSSIGEELTSVRRSRIEANDLPEMERLFKMFSANPSSKETPEVLESLSARCKVVEIDKFSGPHWVVNRWWSREELVAVGAILEADVADAGQVLRGVKFLEEKLEDCESPALTDSSQSQSKQTLKLGDRRYFDLTLGKRVLRKQLVTEGPIPVYSANVFIPMGYLEESNLADFSEPSILWGIDGNFELNIIDAGIPFATTDHCGVLRLKDELLVPDYVLAALRERRREESFDRSFRPALANMRRFAIEVPVDHEGRFDVFAQERAARQAERARRDRQTVAEARHELDALLDRFLGEGSSS